MQESQSKKCRKCHEEIDNKVKKCPKCGAMQGIPIWVIVIVVIVVLAIIGTALGGTEEGDKKENKANKEKVPVVNFSSMTQAEVDTWCETNKVECSMKEDYSDSVAKGLFVSQSVASDRVIYEGDKITVVFSLGKKPSVEYRNALAQAELYSKNMHLSKQVIYEQLISEYGEKFPADAAQYAIDHLED